MNRGHSAECRHERFDEGEGCCWLKRADDQGGACKVGRKESTTTIAGHFSKALHEGGIPGQWELYVGWLAVFGIMALVFAAAMFSRVSPGTFDGLKGLVSDGVSFTLRLGRLQPSQYANGQPTERTPLTAKRAEDLEASFSSFLTSAQVSLKVR